MNENIPKVINYCWFGGKEKSKLIKKCIKSWKEKCPDYEIKEWNENNFDVSQNRYVKEAYKNGKWAFVTDYVRLYVIYNYGGIYLDTDVELIDTLDSLLSYNSFFATEDNLHINTGLGFGALKNNKMVKILLDSYNNISFYKENGEMDLTPCTERNTITLEKYIGHKLSHFINKIVNDSLILSKDYFCPYDSLTGIMQKTDNTIGIHWFNASWRNKKINLKKKLLRPIKRIIGIDRFNYIKETFLKKRKLIFEVNKIGIVSLYDNNNYGNRLQNYAMNKIIKHLNFNPENILINDDNYIVKSRNLLKKFLKINKKTNLDTRFYSFEEFNKNMIDSKCLYGFLNMKMKKSKSLEYRFFIVGSDQVWNPGNRGINSYLLLKFAEPSKRISYAASISRYNFPKKYKKSTSKELSKFKAISVREDRGKEIVEELTGRKDVEVLVDPTMLLTAEEWDKVSKKPKMLKTDKYILNYFLGDLSDERRKEIDRVAKENNCEVINILDKNSPFYECGPSEFLYLEKHAFLICTDSFHSCVFAILYNTPFLVFDREQKNLVSMNSRLDTLLSKFKLENRRCNGKITKKDLTCDYKEAYKILDKERIKADKFLRKALDIKDSD